MIGVFSSAQNNSGASPSPFSPSQLFAGGEVGCFYNFTDTSSLWQDVSATTQADTNGDLVARADDLSGNGANLLQPTSPNRPVFESGSGVSFDGSNDTLLTTAYDPKFASSSFFMVLKPESINDSEAPFSIYGGWGAIQLRFNSGLLEFRAHKGGAYRTVTSTLSVGQNYSILCLANQDYVRLFVDNSQVGNVAEPTPINYQGSENGLNLGANRNDGAATFSRMKTKAFVHINRALTPSEISSIFSWSSSI